MNEEITSTYRHLLTTWVKSARADLYTLPDRPDLVAYGTGDAGHWATQTQQKALSAFAVLAADPELDETRAGMSRQELRELSVAMLRFTMASHLTGNHVATDGRQWGNTWIGVLGLERMAHALPLMTEWLSADDHHSLRRMMLNEANWLLDHYHRGNSPADGTIHAGMASASGHNDPESNLWNGAFLHRAAMIWPDAPRAAAYREKGDRFLVNAISIPADADDPTPLAGRPVKDWHVGANFFPSMALNHHGYLNIGYMAICLSNAAMLHFSCRLAGTAPPPTLHHHLAELWRLVRECTFPDGRLLRLGGDTRVRYCYCQDYAIPAWLLAMDLWQDPLAPQFEDGWLRLVAQEQTANGDGSFLGERGRALRHQSPLYFTRLEADRACSLAMGLAWRRQLQLPEPLAKPRVSGVASAKSTTPRPDFSWHDDFHGASCVRTAHRLAAFCWHAAEPPQATILPPSRSDLAEWRHNLTGEILGLAERHRNQVAEHRSWRFPGGFLTCGLTHITGTGFIAEGSQPETHLADKYVVFAALPDGHSALLMQYATTRFRTYLTAIKGLLLHIPNDLFNHGQRQYRSENGACELRGPAELPGSWPAGRWLVVDDAIAVATVYGDESLTVHQPGGRRIGIGHHGAIVGTIASDEICCGRRAGSWDMPPHSVLLDLGAAIATTGDEQAVTGWRQHQPPPCPGVRIIHGQGQDRCHYLLAANFATEPAKFSIPAEFPAAATVIAGDASATGRQFALPPKGTCLLAAKH